MLSSSNGASFDALGGERPRFHGRNDRSDGSFLRPDLLASGMPLGTSNQDPRGIVEQGLGERPFHLTSHEPDILEHAIIEFGQMHDLAAVLQSLGDIGNGAENRPQERRSGEARDVDGGPDHGSILAL
jgi:hypothetical protein